MLKYLTIAAMSTMILVGQPVADERQRDNSLDFYSGDLEQLRKRAETGDTVAQSRLGFLYDRASNFSEALRWYRKAAAERIDAKFAIYRIQAGEGDVDSQFKMGKMYEKHPADTARWDRKHPGHFPNYSAQLAVKWYRKAAEQGHAEAQYRLGNIFETGRPSGGGMLGGSRRIDVDSAEAATWYRLAAEQGHVVAQIWLGRMYERGEGVPQDAVMAHKWYNMASAQGHELAGSYRTTIEGKMTPDQIAEAQRLAREWMAEHR